jgi:hypothetical protein
MNTQGFLCIEYRCQPDGAEPFAYRLELDAVTLEPRRPAGLAPPWTLLGNAQCPNCPLDPAQQPHCPAALALAPLLAGSGDLPSHTPVGLEVSTPERCISARTSMQRVLGSLSGLLLATSGCPHTAFLKPMARFHLPLASDLETAYRATAMYALGQYFVRQDGALPDLDLSGLQHRYGELQRVNRALARRLAAVSCEDAAVNALVLLDTLAKGVPYTVADSLAELRPLFSAYAVTAGPEPSG